MAVATAGPPQQRWLEDAGRARLSNNARGNRPTNSYTNNSQAMTTVMARAEITKQRRLNDESPRPGAVPALNLNDYIVPVQLPKSNDEGIDNGHWIDDTVEPDDSLTGRDRISKRRDQAKMCEREMVELRRLVQSDDRFGWALEKTCQAIYECIGAGNPAPVLALLASLVWRSLCIAWELEPQAKLDKTHLRSEVAGLKVEQQHIVDSFDEARARYLKELVVLRDQVRKGNQHASAAVHKVVYEQEPVIFYEPLKYLSEEMRLHMAEIVEEKLKQLMATLQDLPYTAPERKQDQKEEEEESDEDVEARQPMRSRTRTISNHEALRRDSEGAAAAEDAARRVQKLLKEGQMKNEALTKTIDSLQADLAAVEADLCCLMSKAQAQFDEMSGVAGEHAGINLGPPPDLKRTYDIPSAENNIAGNEFSSGMRQRSDYIVDVLDAEMHVRKSLLARLEESKLVPEINIDTPAVPQSIPNRSSSGADTAALKAELAAAAKAAAGRERELREALSQQEAARKNADERATAAEKDKAKLHAELEQGRATFSGDDESQQQKDRELASALQKIQDLNDEIEKLRMLLDELSTGDDGKVKERLKSVGLVWRKPTRQVHERLFQDSVDRQERRRSLIASLELARDEQALEISNSSMLPGSSHIREAPSAYEDDTSFGSGVLKSQAGGWLMDHSNKSLPSLHPLAETSTPAAASLAARYPSPPPQPNLSAARSLSPLPVQPIMPLSPPSNGIPFPFPRPRSSSPGRSCSPGPGLEVEGRNVGRGMRSNSPDAAAAQAARVADLAGEKLGTSGFAAALGLTYKSSQSDLQLSTAERCRPHLRTHSPTSTGSRPTSAKSTQALRKARATITARPRSAALPAIQRIAVHRPLSETSLHKEAQRLLAAPTNPTAKLGRSASAPGVRGDDARGLSRRTQSGVR